MITFTFIVNNTVFSTGNTLSDIQVLSQICTNEFPNDIFTVEYDME